MNGEPAIPRRVHIFLGLYLAAHLAYRCLFPTTLNLDEAQQLLLAQRFEWGYNAQPPLYTWLQILFFGAFGTNVFALGALKVCLLYGFFAASLSLARRLFRHERWAAAALATLFLSPEICWGTLSNLTHTVLLLLALALTWGTELALSERRTPARYAALGLCLALGIHSKYSYAAVVLAMAAAMLLLPAHRRVLLDRRMFLALGVALAALLPHALWLRALWASEAGGELTSKISVGGRGAALRTVGDVWSDIAYAVVWPFLGIVAAFRRRTFVAAGGAGETPDAWNGLFRFYSLGVSILLTCFGFLAAGTHVRSRWVYPFFLFFPFAMLVRLRRAEGSDAARKTLVAISCAVGIGAFVAFSLRPLVGPVLGDRPRLTAPFAGVAEAAIRMGFRDGVILASHDYLAGGLRLNLPGASACAPGLGFDRLPALRGRKILLVWTPGPDGRPPAEMERLVASAGLPWPTAAPERIELPYARSERERMVLDAILVEGPR